MNTRTLPHCDAVALGIEHIANLRELAIALDDVFDRSGLHQECVASCSKPAIERKEKMKMIWRDVQMNYRRCVNLFL